MATHIDDEDRFVEVVAITTKTKQSIPREWLDHPILGRNFELPPSVRDQQAGVPVEETPNEEWTVALLETYATNHDIDLAGATRKADILAAIEAAPQTADATEAPVTTAATADTKEK